MDQSSDIQYAVDGDGREKKPMTPADCHLTDYNQHFELSPPCMTIPFSHAHVLLIKTTKAKYPRVTNVIQSR